MKGKTVKTSMGTVRSGKTPAGKDYKVTRYSKSLSGEGKSVSEGNLVDRHPTYPGGLGAPKSTTNRIRVEGKKSIRKEDTTLQGYSGKLQKKTTVIKRKK